MSITDSMCAVQDAIHRAAGCEDRFQGKRNVVVRHLNDEYVYKNVYVSAYYDASFGQMTVIVDWDDDKTQPPCKEIGLFGKFCTNFQEFSFADGYLRWSDKKKRISIDFSQTEQQKKKSLRESDYK